MNRAATSRTERLSRFAVSRGSNDGASASHGRTPSAGLITPLPCGEGLGVGERIAGARRRPNGRTLPPKPLPRGGGPSAASRLLLSRQQLAELRMREVHRHVVAERPGLADLFLRQQAVGADRVFRVELLRRLQVAGGVGPAFLVVPLP